MAQGDPSEHSVREASGNDVESFAAFLRTAWQQAGPSAPGFAGATDEVIAELTAADAIRQRIGGPERRMHLAWDGGTVVGFAATKRVDAGTVELTGIVVLRSYAGQGVGTALVQAALDRAKDELYQSMTVHTETTNDAARAFYEACGFEMQRITTEHVDDLAVEVWELSQDLQER